MQEIENLLKKIIIDKWVLNGHSLTGAFEDSLEVTIEDGNFLLYGNSYGNVMNEGVEPQNIPYTRRKRGQGQGGTSKYLTGLINYVKLRLGINDDREAMGVAFAIAETHKQNGILGSGFLDEAISELEEQLGEKISNLFDKKIKEII